MKPSQSNRIRIVNPVVGGSAFTSRRRAEEYRDRGRAVFVGDGFSIRFLDASETALNRQAAKDRLNDESYWAEVARRRLGVNADRMRFKMVRSANKPTMPGGPEGTAITAFIPVIEHSRGA